MKVYTIGYGNDAPATFVRRLVSAGIRTAVDLRLRPDRASMGAYVKAKSPDKGIERLLSQAGLAYRSLPELGNVFLDFEDWAGRYSALLQCAGHLLTTRLDGLAEPLCLLCAERDAARCHRRHIAEFLGARGHEIQHLE